MKINNIRLYNFKQIYDLISYHYNTQGDMDLGIGGIGSLMGNATIIFDVVDISPMELCYIKELASSILPTAKPQLQRSFEAYKSVDELHHMLRNLVAMLDEYRSLHLHELNYDNIWIYPSAIMSLSYTISFTGVELAKLLGFYDPAKDSSDDASDQELSSIMKNLNAQRNKPYIKFFKAVDERLHDSNVSLFTSSGNEMTTGIDFAEDAQNPVYTAVSDELTQRFLETVYGIMDMNRSARLMNMSERYNKSVYFKFNGKTSLHQIMSPFGAIPISQSWNIKDQGTVVHTLVNETQKHNQHILSNGACSENAVAMETKACINMRIILYDYIELINIIPYNWITYVCLPDSEYAASTANLYTTHNDHFMNRLDSKWDKRNRLADTIVSIYRILSTHTDKNADIVGMTLTPLSSEVCLTLQIPVLEGAIILQEAINYLKSNTAKSVFKNDISSILEECLTLTKTTYQLVLSSTE